MSSKICKECNINKDLNLYRKGRNSCKECNISKSKCIHNIQKYSCKICNCVSICEHGIEKRRCREGCGGSDYCIHNKRIPYCREGCGGSAYCIHDKEKKYCREGCGGSAYCIHGKNKKLCREGCGGSAYCIHGKQKVRCREGCGGSLICEHSKERHTCIECSPDKSCKICKNKYVKKSTKFYPLCEACFSFSNPNSNIITAYKIKERYVCDKLKELFKDENIEMIVDKKIEGGCSLRRPDILIDKLTHCIIIECDEEQHKNYDCENKRTMELFKDLGNRHLIIIRFNPDCYTKKNKNKEKSCFKPIINIEDIHRKKFYDIVKTEWERRILILEDVVKKYLDLNTFPDKELTIVQLFYDYFD